MHPKLNSSSTSNFNTEYRSLVDEFRAFKQGACISAEGRMNEEAFYSNWESPGFGPASGSGSNSNSNGESSAGTVVLTPKSSDVSNSESPVGESEGNGAIGSGREMTSMERSRTHSCGATPALRKEMSLTLEQEELMEDGLPSHRPRKGHKKSRGGCYNCKRRKIKVGPIYLMHLMTPQSSRLDLVLLLHIRTNFHTVSRKPTSMSQLHSEESGLQIPSSKNTLGIAGLGPVLC